MPAQIASNTMQQANSQQQTNQTPNLLVGIQANSYQPTQATNATQLSQQAQQVFGQQLSASKQHFIQQQQRLNNGLYSPAATDDGSNNSNDRSMQAHFEQQNNLYNGVNNIGVQQQRPAPIYAPKPIYYSSPQTRPQPQPQLNGGPYFSNQAPQNSPSSSMQLQATSESHLNGRQMTSNNANNVSIQSQNGSILAATVSQQQQMSMQHSPSTMDRRAAQMQHAMAMSYQVQPQAFQSAPAPQLPSHQLNHQIMQQHQQQAYVQQQQQPNQQVPHGATMLDGSFVWQPMAGDRAMQQQQQQMQPTSMQQHHLVVEQQQQQLQQLSTPPPHMARQHQQQQHSHPQQPIRYSTQATAAQLETVRTPFNTSTLNRSHISDRDSISTISRMNQFDERRSITMRSQFTTNHTNRDGSKRQFGFLELTGEAFRRLLGFGATGDANNAISAISSARVPLLNERQKLVQNANLDALGPSVNPGSSHQLNVGLSASQPPVAQLGHTKVTVIDSAEDYHFKRQVFKYQLRILLMMRFIFSAVVLLSPVTMLLVPKMEPLLHSLSPTEPTEYSSSNPTLPIPAMRAGSLTPGVITHGVGLAHKQTNPSATGGQNSQPNQSIQWRIGECNLSECDGPLIGFVVRLLMLAVAHWAIFFRTQTSTLPRIDFHRCLLASMTLLITLAYWLFFIFRIFDKRFNDFELQYLVIVNFTVSMLESLILLHYLGVVLLELRSRKKIYCLKVVRSPDGESHYYSCGSLSIQKCARFVLEKYHREFNHYDSHSEQVLALESEVAHGGATKSSSATSNHQDRLTDGGRSSRRRQRSERPVSSARSTSRSPARSVRSERRGESRSRSEAAQTKVYQVDLGPPSTNRANNNDDSNQTDKNELREKREGVSSNDKDNSQQAHENNSNSNNQIDTKAKPVTGEDFDASNSGMDGGHSSDATSRVKESSLETIRAAGSVGGGLNSQQINYVNSEGDRTRDLDLEVNESSRRSYHSHKHHRDDIESVRSARSRKSTSRHRESRHRANSSHHRASSSHHSRSHGHSHSHHGHGSSNREESGLSIADHERQTLVDNSSNAVEEHDRKLRRRQLRLLATVEDAFEQVHRRTDAVSAAQKIIQSPSLDANGNATVVETGALGTNNNQRSHSTSLDASQTARALYPCIARSLQKYLRLTRQAGRHNLQSIHEHLSKCLLYGLSARTFIEKFVQRDPVWQQSETELFANCRLESDISRPTRDDFEINTWSLICDTFVSREISSGTFFLLRQGQVSLLVTVAKLPHTNINEEVLDQRMCKFSLGPKDSETSSV